MKICDGPECDRKAIKLGLCDTHYQQYTKRADRRLTPIGSTRIIPVARSLDRNENGEKYCHGEACGEWLPENQFHKDPSNPDGLMNRCKGCRRKKKLARQYNVPLLQLAAMWVRQKHRCATCPKEAGWLELCVDHDRSCCNRDGSCGKCVRGLLCHGCNLAAGNTRDNPETLRNLANYLESYENTKKGIAGHGCSE